MAKREVFFGVTVDPEVCFGRPYISHRGIVCAIVVSRFRAGESVEDIAWDYDISEDEVNNAIRWSLLHHSTRKRLLRG